MKTLQYNKLATLQVVSTSERISQSHSQANAMRSGCLGTNIIMIFFFTDANGHTLENGYYVGKEKYYYIKV